MALFALDKKSIPEFIILYLELDDRQTERIREASFETQTQLLELMKIPRERGGPVNMP